MSRGPLWLVAEAGLAFAATTRRARRANLRRDAGRLESVGTCRLGLSRFVSAGAVVDTGFVELSATVRGDGEPARFRPGGVGDPDTGCSLPSPRGADVD